MKRLYLIAVAAMGALAAELPPVPDLFLVQVTNDQKHVKLSWTHPIAYTFDIQCVADGIYLTNSVHNQGAKVNRLHSFDMRIKPAGVTNVYSVRAVFDDKSVSGWSRPITHIRPTPLLP